VNLEFSVEQQALRDSVRNLLAAHASAGTLRALWTSETGRSPRIWELLSEVGVPALLISPEFGGAGGDELDLLLVLEEVGRAALPDAVIESVLLAPYLIASAASATVQERWLPSMASGSARVAVALGPSRIAPDLHISDAVLLEHNGGVALVETSDVHAQPIASMDPSRRLFRITAVDGSGQPLGEFDRTALAARSWAGSAAVLNGVARHLIDCAADYSKVRTQFGRPIGSFQALKHQLAHAASLTALARHATIAATWSIARRRSDLVDAAALAHLCAVEAETEANRVALQVHGGIGFTWEYDLQVWLKYGKTLELAYGAGREVAEIAGLTGFGPTASRSV
jgi:alkylation response protein AidB-like acyl-CoA dehydrogenase